MPNPGWQAYINVKLKLLQSDWEALVTLAHERGLQPADVAMQAIKRELSLPAPYAWEIGIIHACLQAQSWELSVLNGEPIWPPSMPQQAHASNVYPLAPPTNGGKNERFDRAGRAGARLVDRCARSRDVSS